MKQKVAGKFALIAVNENNMFYSSKVAPFLKSHNIHFLAARATPSCPEI